MPASLEGQLVVALSSRALFDFEEENRVFEDQDDSANEVDVRAALEGGFPGGAGVFNDAHRGREAPAGVRIAFDGDSVLFSDEAERVFKEQGLAAFQDHEERQALKPLPPGPFLPLLEALHRLRADSAGGKMKIRTALVTAHSAPAHERAIRTLMEWKVEVDEAMFLGGLEKSRFLHEFKPDFFFDDQTRHCEPASRLVPTEHVVSGVANQG